ncbi:mitochondrial 37S ribosomal protein bS21m [Apiospora aurea]|uniref:Ribosomal protein S21 n=1 Tax=Apiospora aurea TaxID=335848 RepID=A0ABR1QKD2_9PEZI
MYPRAAELSRVANAAMRSASSVRATSSTLRLTSSPARASHGNITASLRALSINGCQMRTKRHYADWASPSRPSRPAEEENIVKPTGPSSSTSSSSSSADGSAPRSPLSAFRNRNSGRIFDAPDPDFTVPGLGRYGLDSSIDATDFSAFKPGDFNKRGTPDELAAMAAKKPVVRCVARTGRTQYVSKGADVGRAFKMLEMQCTSNRVRADFQKQRYHERNGLKRKRLASERWQKRFKGGFKATCKRVSELRRQGW